jgi:hypothetical protein
MTEFKLRHRETLLRNIAVGVAEHECVAIEKLEVLLIRDGVVVATPDLVKALHDIVNDIHKDNHDDWSEATNCLVKVIGET